MTAIERRHISINGQRTTVAMEGIFWLGAELAAIKKGKSWQEWVAFVLANCPPDAARMSWLRQRIYLAKQ